MNEVPPHHNIPTFDPDAAAQPGAGVFGLPFTRDESAIVLIPAPFDATTSYGGGASAGPEAIRAASAQVDLHDLQFGPVYRRGIFMEPDPADIRTLSAAARKAALPIIATGGVTDPPSPDEARLLSEVQAASEQVNAYVYERTRAALAERKLPGLIGGDHSTPFGSIRACAEHAATLKRGGLGILHLDAHMDFRDAFEGFAWSHASIMHNVMSQLHGIDKLVQIGLRDVGKGEIDFAAERAGIVYPHYDGDWARRLLDGEKFSAMLSAALKPLPELVYISVDIDALDPSLCPHTGTPVPGGLSFAQAALILEKLATSGRTLIGFDLVEVCPAPGDNGDEWDANVGARILYKLCGVAAACGFNR